MQKQGKLVGAPLFDNVADGAAVAVGQHNVRQAPQEVPQEHKVCNVHGVQLVLLAVREAHAVAEAAGGHNDKVVAAGKLRQQPPGGGKRPRRVVAQEGHGGLWRGGWGGVVEHLWTGTGGALAAGGHGRGRAGDEEGWMVPAGPLARVDERTWRSG